MEKRDYRILSCLHVFCREGRAQSQEHANVKTQAKQMACGMSQASFRFSTGIFASLPHSVSQYSAPNDAAQSDVGLNGGQYDDIARLAAQLCDAPIAIVSTIEAGNQVRRPASEFT